MFDMPKRELDPRYWLVFAIVPLRASNRVKKEVIFCFFHPLQVEMCPLELSLGCGAAWQQIPCFAD